MQQPLLGKRLTALRKAKNLTQEELVMIPAVAIEILILYRGYEYLAKT